MTKKTIAVTNELVANSAGATVTSLTPSFTLASGGNAIAVAVGWAKVPEDPAPAITVSFGAASMGAAVIREVDPDDRVGVDIFLLVGATPGTETVTIGLDVARRITVSIVGFSNVEALADSDGDSEDSATGAKSPTVTLTTEAGGMAFGSSHWRQSAASWTAGSGETGDDDQGIGGQNSRGAYSYKAAVGASTTVEHSISSSAANNIALAAIALEPEEEDEPDPDPDPDPPAPPPIFGLGFNLGFCSRKPVTLAELRYPRCANRYGIAGPSVTRAEVGDSLIEWLPRPGAGLVGYEVRWIELGEVTGDGYGFGDGSWISLEFEPEWTVEAVGPDVTSLEAALTWQYVFQVEVRAVLEGDAYGPWAATVSWPIDGATPLSFCLAQLGVTGADRCYNSLATCQDRENYDPSETVTLLFSDGGQDVPLEWGAIPSLAGASVKPTRINIAGLDRNSGQLGLRAAATVRFMDHPDGDRLTDPYVEQRSYDPNEQGTFWPKWIARTSEEWGAIEVDVLTGDAAQTFDSLTRRAYFFETVDGPDAAGNVVLTARDILSRADGRKVQAPRPTTAVTTTELFADSLQIAATDVDEAEFPATGGTLRIGSELIRYEVLTTDGLGSYLFTDCTRGTDGTTAAAHSFGSTIQACVRFSGERPTAIIKTLLVDYADVPESWIPLEEWEAEEDRWLQPYLDLAEVVISKPEGVADVIADLCRSIMAYIWTDDRGQKVRFRAVRPPEETLIEIDDRLHVLPGGQSREVRMEEQVSATRIFYGMINLAGDLDDEANYRRGVVRPGVQIGAPRVRDIYSRWLANASQASLAARTLLGASNGLPIYVSATVGMNKLDAVTGGVVELSSRLVTDASGARDPLLYAIVEADDDATEARLLLRSFGRFAPVCLYMGADAPDFGDATEDERRRGAWFADADGKLNGAPSPYVFS